MLKRLSIVLAATAVMGVCMAMMPQRVEGAPVQKGTLKFTIAHGHNIYPNRWVWGRANHWGPSGDNGVGLFRHVSGPESVNFGQRRTGSSRGYAGILWPFLRPCNWCSDAKSYTVKANQLNNIQFTLRAR
jgi:hypothetical protein